MIFRFIIFSIFFIKALYAYEINDFKDKKVLEVRPFKDSQIIIRTNESLALYDLKLKKVNKELELKNISNLFINNKTLFLVNSNGFIVLNNNFNKVFEYDKFRYDVTEEPVNDRGLPLWLLGSFDEKYDKNKTKDKLKGIQIFFKKKMFFLDNNTFLVKDGSVLKSFDYKQDLMQDFFKSDSYISSIYLYKDYLFILSDKRLFKVNIKTKNKVLLFKTNSVSTEIKKIEENHFLIGKSVYDNMGNLILDNINDVEFINKSSLLVNNYDKDYLYNYKTKSKVLLDNFIKHYQQQNNLFFYYKNKIYEYDLMKEKKKEIYTTDKDILELNFDELNKFFIIKEKDKISIVNVKNRVIYFFDRKNIKKIYSDSGSKYIQILKKDNSIEILDLHNLSNSNYIKIPIYEGIRDLYIDKNKKYLYVLFWNKKPFVLDLEDTLFKKNHENDDLSNLLKTKKREFKVKKDIVYVKDINTNKINVLKEHTGYINSIDFDWRNDLLVSGANDKRIILWSLNSFKLLKSIKIHKRAVKDVFIFNDKVISTSFDNTLKIWDIKKEEVIYEINDYIEFIKINKSKGLVFFIAGDKFKLLDLGNNEISDIYDFEQDEILDLVTDENNIFVLVSDNKLYKFDNKLNVKILNTFDNIEKLIPYKNKYITISNENILRYTDDIKLKKENNYDREE